MADATIRCAVRLAICVAVTLEFASLALVAAKFADGPAGFSDPACHHDGYT